MKIDDPSMRCGTQTLFLGDTILSVQAACGPPNMAEQITDYVAQMWIYNFGPSQSVHYLTVFLGRLQRLQVGEYG